MAINQKQKGNRGEREATKWVKEWTGKDFSRVPSSGGLRWKKTDNITGDITCSEEGHYCPFTFEVKNVKELQFGRLFYKAKSNIEDFYQQAVEDGERANKVPFLMMRYNGLPKGFWFIIVPVSLFKYLQIVCIGYRVGKPRAVFNNKWVLCGSNVIKDIPYKRLRKAAKKMINEQKKRKAS